MKINFKNLFINFILLMICAISIFICTSIDYIKYLACLILIYNVYGIYKSKNNIGLLIIHVFIFWSNYSICAANVFLNLKNMYTNIDSVLLLLMLKILLLFTCIFVVITPKSKKQTISFFEKGGNNYIISCGSILVLILILVYIIILNVGNTGRLDTQPIFEYGVLIAIVGLYFASKNKKLRTIITIEAIVFCLLNFIGGGRVTGMQMIIALVLIYFGHRIKFSFFLIGLALFFILFTAIGIFRENMSFSFDSILVVFGNISEKKGSFDTAYSSFYTSSTFVQYADVCSLGDRLYYAFKFIISIFAGSSNVSNSNLAIVTSKFYNHSYGGILPFFGYF